MPQPHASGQPSPRTQPAIGSTATTPRGRPTEPQRATKGPQRASAHTSRAAAPCMAASHVHAEVCSVTTLQPPHWLQVHWARASVRLRGAACDTHDVAHRGLPLADSAVGAVAERTAAPTLSFGLQPSTLGLTASASQPRPRSPIHPSHIPAPSLSLAFALALASPRSVALSPNPKPRTPDCTCPYILAPAKGAE